MLVRFFQIYIIQGLLFVLCVVLGYRTLKRNRNRLNLVFAGFYICIAIGLFLNFVYAPLQMPGLQVVVLFLNFLTNYFLTLGAIFFVIFELILIKSEKSITTKVQVLILVIYGLVLFIMILFLSFGGPFS